MQITRTYTDDDGESHFDLVEVSLTEHDFAPPAPPLLVSAPVPAEQMVLIGIPLGWHGDWHPAPRRQYWVGLRGQLDVTVSDGETRRFGPGDVVLLEDTSGRGHVTREVGGEPVHGLFVQL
jgi:quercetin dioxygenase-like cupin family protein